MTAAELRPVTQIPHIVFLVGHYPPSGESGARRPFNVVREFRRAGWDVDVVVVQPGPPEPVLGTVCELVHYARRVSAATPQRARRLVDHFTSRMPRHRDDTSPYWENVRRTMAPLLRADSVVYVSAPPPSLATFAASLVAADRAQCSLILEFRDPWQFKFWAPWRHLISSRLRRQRERTLLAADAIVAVTTGISEALRELAPSAKHLVAMSGIPDDLLQRTPRVRHPEDPLRILYLGEFYLKRDPRPVLDAIAALVQRGQIAPHSIVLQFVGEVEHTPSGPLRALLAERGLSDIAQLQSRVEHEQARQLLAQADIFLLHAERQPRQVPNKLYEYLAYRRPILAVADHDGATAGLLRTTGHGHTLISPNAPSGAFEAALAETLSTARSGALVGDPTALESLRASSQLSATVELADTLLQDRRASGWRGPRTV